jgi:chromosomal replication initiation ATPase DnaA
MRLDLARARSQAFDNFIPSPSNAQARAVLETWPRWPGGRLALVGPEGSGKTHLARAWARQVDAVVLSGQEQDLSELSGRPLLLEDADRRPADETLFHLINLADAGATLLITGRAPPRCWPTKLPDLRSRLNAMLVAQIEPPDEVVLAGALRQFFLERNIRPADDVFPYLLRRIERSIGAARDIVSRIDELAAGEKRDITRNLARRILEDEDRTLDLFE